MELDNASTQMEFLNWQVGISVISDTQNKIKSLKVC